MNQDKDYFAFISYQRKDEEWADWLRNKLEHYRLPSSVRKKDASLPKEIRPIFRDALELAGGVLAKEIETALQNSKFLIVICSPNSAKSPWVNKEIQTFIDLGHEDRIIPFIIDGTPFSDNEGPECFPPSLRSLQGEKELLGININELSRDAAFIKVVARMFGLKFDTLWQRYEREKKRKRWLIVGGALLLAVVAIVIASVFFNLNNKLKSTIDDRDNALLLADSALTQVRKDSVILAEHLERIMRDSFTLARQKDSIRQQKDEIATERDNVIRANWKMMENQSRFVSKNIMGEIEAGDYYAGTLVALECLPQTMLSPNKPFVPEAELALRSSILHNSFLYDANTVDFIPNDKCILTSSKDHTIKLWNVSNGNLICSFEGHTNNVNTACFLPDGSTFYSASEDGSIRIWNINLQKPVRTLNEHNQTINQAVYDKKDNSILYLLENRTIKKWHLNTNDTVSLLTPTIVKGRIEKIALSNTSSMMAVLAKDTVIVWNTKSPEERIVIPGKHVGNINFTPDDTKVIINQIGEVKIYDLIQRKWFYSLESSEYKCNVAFSPNGKVMVYSNYGKKISLFDLNSKKITDLGLGVSEDLRSLSFSHDGKTIVSSSDEKIIEFRNIAPCHNYDFSINTHDGDNWFIRNIAISSDGKYLLSSTFRDSVKIWDANNGQHIISLNIKKGLCFNPAQNDEILVSSTKWGLSLINWKTKKLIKQYKKESALSTAGFASFSKDGKKIVSIHEDKIVVWNAFTAEPIYELMENSPKSAMFDPDNRSIVIARSRKNTAKIIDFTDLSEYELQGHSGVVNYAEYSANGEYILTASEDGTIRIWNSHTRKTIRILDKHYTGILGGIHNAYFSPDNLKVVFSSITGDISIWDIISGSLVFPIVKVEGTSPLVMFNPKGTVFYSTEWQITTKSNLINSYRFEDLQQILKGTRNRFKNRKLTHEERRKYYLE